MTWHDAAAARRRQARWAAVALSLAIVGTALVGAVLVGPSGPTAGQVPQRSTTVPVQTGGPGSSEPRTGGPARGGSGTEPRPTAGAPRAGAVPAETQSRPVHLAIPAIGVSQRLLRLGLQKDRTVEVPAPSDAEYPGWYELGTSPGELGSAVILGHVDSTTGPAVFYELRSLEAGNRVDVRLENGAVAHFAVEDVTTYPNAEFPAQKVYTSQGYRGLNLVTCGGQYDKARGGYQSNVVAYTRWTSTTPAA